MVSPRDEARRNLSADWPRAVRQQFLGTLARTGSARLAAEAVDRPVEAAYALRARAPRFDAGWRAAVATGIARLREVALDRALNGAPRPARSVAGEPAFSDTLLLGLLRLYDLPGESSEAIAGVSRAVLMARLDAVARSFPDADG